MEQPPASRSAVLRELAAVFLKLGLTAFGGPAAHVALMEQEFVRQRGWLTHEEFLDLLGAANLIPGPNSTEMAIHIGRKRAGWPGLLVAGSAFILPAMLLVGGFAWAYVRFGRLPQLGGVLYGVKPVIIAVVLQALWGLGRRAVKNRALALLGLVAGLVNFFCGHELLVLFGSGLLLAAAQGAGRRWVRPTAGSLAVLGLIPGAPALAGSAGAVVPFGLGALFGFFLKVGAVLFGSGYVLLAFLQADLVQRWHWLGENQLMDAIAVGQFTPGPLFTTATFIGYLLAGVPGALVATAGIFLPAFFFVAVSAPLLPRLRRSLTAGAFLDGVNVASLALMAVVSVRLGVAALPDLPAVLLALVAGVLLLRWKINSAWLILGGALVGLGWSALRGG